MKGLCNGTCLQIEQISASNTSLIGSQFQGKHQCSFHLGSFFSFDQLVKEKKDLSWVYGVDRKICHEGH